VRISFGKRLTLGALAAALFVGASALPASATSGTGFDNTNPAAGPDYCATGSVPIKTVNLYANGVGPLVGYMEVRYSSKCGTNWVRVYNINTPDARSQTYIQRPAQGSLPASVPITSDNVFPGGWAYGYQLYAAGSTCINVQGRLSASAFTADSGVIYLC